MAVKRNNIYFVFSVFVLAVILPSSYFIIINSAWYSWREINRFKKNPKSYGDLGEGGKIYPYFDNLVAKREIEHSQIPIAISFSSGEVIEDIKRKFPSLIWIRIHQHEAQISDEYYNLYIWAKSGDAALVKDYIAKKGWLSQRQAMGLRSDNERTNARETERCHLPISESSRE
jgi:hypothetical protein